MRPDLMSDYPRLRMAANSVFTALGLFLLVFLGAQAFTQIRSDDLVRGKPRQTSELGSDDNKSARTVQLKEQATLALIPNDEVKTVPKKQTENRTDHNEAEPMEAVGVRNKKRP